MLITRIVRFCRRRLQHCVQRSYSSSSTDVRGLAERGRRTLVGFFEGFGRRRPLWASLRLPLCDRRLAAVTSTNGDDDSKELAA